MKEKVIALFEQWKREDAKLKADYDKLVEAETVIGKDALERYKLELLRERGRLTTCIIELQQLLFD